VISGHSPGLVRALALCHATCDGSPVRLFIEIEVPGDPDLNAFFVLLDGDHRLVDVIDI
jgi:hypothetical protein